MSLDDVVPEPGRVDAALADELPGLRLRSALVAAAGAGPTPPGLRRRLEEMTTRFRGAEAVQLRRRPVPHAYRVLFRHLGLDPDRDRTPVEQAVLRRLVSGRFGDGDRVADALAVAVVETGVPLVALDDATLRGSVVLRLAREGERLAAGEHAHDVPVGRLVLADGAGLVAVAFGRLSSRHACGPRTRGIRLVAVVAPGVPEAHVGEALWLAREALVADA